MTRLLRFLICLIFYITNIFAQPYITPEQTVNTATGEMAFSLPLGVARGANGNDYPLNLLYSAGIQYDAEASDVGLGFGIVPGGINRKMVVIEDNNVGGVKYDCVKWEYDFNDPTTFEDIMSIIFAAIILIVSVVICAVSAGTLSGGSVAGISGAMAVLSTISASIGVLQAVYGLATTISMVAMDPAINYRGGGGHTLVYNYEGRNGVGFLNGGEGDLPDIYFVNTPFLSGQIVRVDEKWQFRKLTGGFKNEGGERQSTVSVSYEDEVFIITAANGTRLFFEKNTRFARSFHVFGGWEEENVPPDEADWAEWDYHVQFKGCLPQQWLLTKVLFNDYVGNENPLEGDNNLGSWIVFEYNAIEEDIYKYPQNNRVNGDRSVIDVKLCSFFSDDPVVIQYLKRVVTPNETAEFNYEMDREDGSWLYASGPNTGSICPLPRLKNIKIYPNGTEFPYPSGEERKTINFNTSYKLRWIDEHQPVNDHGTLTLDDVNIMNKDGTESRVVFEYGRNPSIDEREHGWYTYHGETVNRVKDKQDKWGYYREFPFPESAEAWSLKKVYLPGGKFIEWAYEIHTFSRANQHSFDKIFIEGGIRVKKMIVRNKMGDYTTYNYFYTNDKGIFNDGTTSGHATILPFNPASGRTDERPHNTRGGIYTPTKVSYDLVQVVENYDSVNNVCPNGYTTYEYTTSNDYKNEERFGTLDHSLKLGLLKCLEQYNKEGKKVSGQEFEYEFTNTFISPYNSLISVQSTFDCFMSHMVCGSARIRKEKNFLDDVVTEKDYLFSSDFEEDNEDKVEDEYQKFTHFVTEQIWTNHGEYGFQTGWHPYIDITKSFGDPTKIDIVFAYVSNFDENYPNKNYGKLLVGIFYDVDFESDEAEPYDKLETVGFKPDYSDYYYDAIYGLSGIDIVNWDGNGKPDLIIQNTISTLHYYLLLDIEDKTEEGHQVPESIVPYRNICTQLNEFQSFIVPGRGNLHSAVGDIDKNGYFDILYYIPEYGSGRNEVWVAVCDINEPGAGIPYRIKTLDEEDNLSKYRRFHFINYDDDEFKDELYFSEIKISSNKKDGIHQERAYIVDDIHFEGDNIVMGTNKIPMHKIDYWRFLDKYDQHGTAGRVPCGMISLWDIDNNVRKVSISGLMGWGGRLAFIKNELKKVENDFDGNPNYVIETNSDNTKGVAQSIPGYVKYSELEDDHSFITSVGSVIYGTEIAYSNVLAAHATFWNNFTVNGHTIFKPNASYTWYTEYNKDGSPKTTFEPFDFTTPSNNDDTKWLLISEILKYDKYFNAVETADKNNNGGKTYASNIYGYNYLLLVGRIINARFVECGVFTCDYDNNETNNSIEYFDLFNGWEKGIRSGGSCEVTDLYSHFGEKCVLVADCFGPTKNIKVDDPLKDYIFSAWICCKSPVAPKFARMAVEFHSDIPNGAATQIGSFDKEVTLTEDGSWKLYEHIIESENLPEDIEYFRIWIGGSEEDPDVYLSIDDIRFYPSDAFVTSTYYDQDLQVPNVSVDANNFSENKVVYDDFGRETMVYNNDGVLIEKKEYHLMNNKLRIIEPMGFNNEHFGEIEIEWKNDTENPVNIYYSPDNRETWNLITSTAIPASQEQYTWDVPSKFKTSKNAYILIRNSNNPKEWCISDGFILHKMIPNGGEEWPRGRPHNIKWNIDPVITEINLEFSIDNGSSWTLIQENVTNIGLGEYKWIIPYPVQLSDQCLIRIINEDTEEEIIRSDEVFSIVRRKWFTYHYHMNIPRYLEN